ncbi:hypothetical protein J45TS6_45570 [Paenibacillus sp. J45TS6]|uniref:SIR2 family protein n=1 Tax=unclassified Paenibacillus TaxID=185978 RepID=UPI00191FBF75|nr:MULTISPECIES: SIR2 family protein [unclassified Paenibacillus]BCO11073.1 SIR2 family protein [Paenibacillus sp.]GIP46098.1 hypothetical protein J45TS6_45570 [Paenibacillus sp. J45TS6]
MKTKEIDTNHTDILVEQNTLNIYHYRLDKNLNEGKSLAKQKNEISTFLKQHCSKAENLNFLIGSGCSLPAIPLMGQTFMRIKDDFSNELANSLGGPYSENKDIEGFLNFLKNKITVLETEDSDSTSTHKKAFDLTKKELLRSIDLTYSKDTEDSDLNTTLENYLNFYDRLFKLREFNKQSSPINIFTTNYDLFNEVSMEESDVHYTNGFQGSVFRIFNPSAFNLRLVDAENRYKDKWNAIRRYVKLYKIHGSIDWKFDKSLNAIRQTAFNMDDDPSNVLIYPTVHKHFETQQSPYSELFREFSLNLQRKNSTMIIIGYGFPDAHINHLISQSLNNEDFTLIIFGDRNEMNARDFLEQHKSKHNLHFIGGSLEKENDAHFFTNVIDYLGDETENADAE